MLVEQAAAFYQELLRFLNLVHIAGIMASRLPAGGGVRRCESVATDQGRRVRCETLQLPSPVGMYGTIDAEGSAFIPSPYPFSFLLGTGYRFIQI